METFNSESLSSDTIKNAIITFINMSIISDKNGILNINHSEYLKKIEKRLSNISIIINQFLKPNLQSSL